MSFLCPKCGSLINDFRPEKCKCGNRITVVDGVYQFTNDDPISINENDLKWLGYEKVGVNYEPAYALSQDVNNFGVFGACARKLADILGKDKIVLDLGAGLGQACIPLALENVKTIAVDISQKMISITNKRAQENNVPKDKLICARMNAYNLYLSDNSIDAIIGIDLLHQVDRPQFVMKEIKRVLKEDGVLIRYSTNNFVYTDEQIKENIFYNGVLKDIKTFYENCIKGYEVIPFSSWDKSLECMKNEFEEPEVVETNEKISQVWNLKLGLHKIKTRASGSTQLIPDNIHNDAWLRTEEYAIKKYGECYTEIKRCFNMIGVVEVYRRKTQ